MKILHVIRSVDSKSGGPIAGLRGIASVLESRGHTVHVASLDAPDSEFLSSFPLPVFALGRKGSGVYGLSRDLDQWLLTNVQQYDVVVINGIWQYHTVAAARAAYKLKVPYFVFCHGMLDPWFNERYPLKRLKKQLYWWLFEYWNLKRASSVMFTCEGESILAPKSFWPYRVSGTVLGYGTLRPEFHRDEAELKFRQKFAELGNSPYLLFLSRVHEKKGVDNLIQAFGEVAKSSEDYKLVVAGPASDILLASLKDLAVKMHIDSRIVWTGHLEGQMKWGAIAGCEVFVLPSYQENFGLVLAEAMSIGKPVLTTTGVNIWREIDADGAGIIVAPNKEGVLTGLRKWFATSPSDRASMGRNAASSFEHNFDLRNAAVRLEGVYKAFVK